MTDKGQQYDWMAEKKIWTGVTGLEKESIYTTLMQTCPMGVDKQAGSFSTLVLYPSIKSSVQSSSTHIFPVTSSTTYVQVLHTYTP